MFEEKESLPSAKAHAVADDGDVFVDVGEAHADVRRHVVWALIGVDEIRSVLRNKMVEKVVEVGASRRVGVFHDDETATRVLDEDSAETIAYSCLSNNGLNLRGDFVGALASCREGEFSGVDVHKSRN